MPVRILIIDDDRALTQALSVRLRGVGWSVLICNSATDASAIIVHERPDLVILDVDMPSFSGPEFHQCLRFAKRASMVPVIYLTGHDTELNRRQAFEQGAVAFLSKPFDADRLLSTIRAEIARRSNGLTPH